MQSIVSCYARPLRRPGEPPTATYDLLEYSSKTRIFFSVHQRAKPEQQLGPAVRVHVPGPGADEGQTGADESVDSIPETAVPLMIRATPVGPSEGCIHTHTHTVRGFLVVKSPAIIGRYGHVRKSPPLPSTRPKILG